MSFASHRAALRDHVKEELSYDCVYAVGGAQTPLEYRPYDRPFEDDHEGVPITDPTRRIRVAVSDLPEPASQATITFDAEGADVWIVNHFTPYRKSGIWWVLWLMPKSP